MSLQSVKINSQLMTSVILIRVRLSQNTYFSVPVSWSKLLRFRWQFTFVADTRRNS